MKSLLLLLPVCLLLFACGESIPESKAGNAPFLWRGTLLLGPGKALPFTFQWNPESDTPMVIHNGAERIPVLDVDIQTKGDSLRINMPVFESYFLVNQGKDGWTGEWHDESRGPDYVIPFRARPGALGRFFDEEAEQSFAALPNRWATTFSAGTEDEYPAVAILEAEGDALTGTFLTETGDYRYLEGQRRGDSLFLSAFDGAHAFLFTGKITGDNIEGAFYSGTHWQEPWVAYADVNASLRAAESLTYLKPGYERLTFSFPSTTGDTLRFPSEAYSGKVVIVQLLGSWCPNCMDETRLYAEWYDRYESRGVEFIGLAFERRPTMGDAIAAVEKMKKRLGADYPMAVASLTTSKSTAAEKLPMLNAVLSFPTSIWLDKSGAVRRIHTGFNGPGTGELYDAFVAEYEGLMAEMLAE